MPGDAREEFDESLFVQDTEPFRGELLAYCYRMMGTVDEAEDLVQETYLRAWRAYGQFEHRASVRAWLYRISTNACLSALEGRRRRVVPSDLGPAADDPYAEPTPAGPEVDWLQPIPDALVSSESSDPAAIVAARESLRLALIVSLQHLTARQRAVLVLRDVLGFRASEVAELLDTGVGAVKSTLQRARARLKALGASPDDIEEVSDPQQRALLDGYIAAIENADAAALGRLLNQDATLEATPLMTWFAGRTRCLPFLVNHILGTAGDWTMAPTRANGQPAAVAYRRGAEGAYSPYGIVVLTAAHDGIARIHAFGDPGLVARFSQERQHRRAR